MSETQKNGDSYPVADIIGLLGRVFPEDDPNLPIIGMTADVMVAPTFTALLTDPETVVATAERDGQLAGVSVAVPRIKMGKVEPESDKTAYIYYTAVEPSLQGDGIVGDVMKSLLSQIKERGYEYVERDCMVENGYADKVQKTYQAAIIPEHTYEHDRWGIGRERHFLIDLSLVDQEQISAPDQTVPSL